MQPALAAPHLRRIVPARGRQRLHAARGVGAYQLADNAEVCGDRGSGCRGAEQTLLVDGQAFVAELAVTQMKQS